MLIKMNIQTMVLIAIMIGIAYYLYTGGFIGTSNLMTVQYYRNGIMVPASIVGGVEGVTDITLTANVKNTGQLPLQCYVLSATPTAFIMPASKYPVAKGGTGAITSSLISVAQYDGTSPTFWTKIGCDYTYAGVTKVLTKEGSITLAIQADPVANFDINLTSSSGSGTGGSTPTPNATCLNAGSGCSLGSECCSNSCPSATIQDAFVIANVGSCSAVSFTLSGNCPVSTCTVQKSTNGMDCNSYANYSTAPNGAFSIQVYNTPLTGNCYWCYKVIHTSGQCI